MAICSFIKVNKELSIQGVEQDIKNIIHQKFLDLLDIEPHLLNNKMSCDWIIKYDNIYEFSICLKTSRELEFPHSDNIWAAWAQFFIENRLASEYDAKILDEEYPHCSYEPFSKKVLTFEDYLKFDIFPNHSPEWKQILTDIEISSLPDALKRL